MDLIIVKVLKLIIYFIINVKKIYANNLIKLFKKLIVNNLIKLFEVIIFTVSINFTQQV